MIMTTNIVIFFTQLMHSLNSTFNHIKIYWDQCKTPS